MKMSDVLKRRGAKMKPEPESTAAEPTAPKMFLLAIGFGNGPRIGESFPADHPLVRQYGFEVGKKLAKDFGPEFSTGFFVPAEFGSAYLRAYRERYEAKVIAVATEGMERREAELKRAEDKFQPKGPQPIPLERQVVCIKGAGAIGYTAGRELIGGDRMRGLHMPDGEPWHTQVGDIADAKWLIVRRYPEHFVSVLPDGVAAQDALVCIAAEPITRFHASGEGRIESVIYPGQLISKDDERVTFNPTMFASVGTAVNSRGEMIIVASPQQVVSDSGRPTKSGYVGE